MIKITNLNKRYNEREILSSINLTLPDRGVIALVGASGSGKTTLLNAIGGIDNEYSGKIEIDGVIINRLSDNDLSDFRLENIGYVFQNFNLINLESVMCNVKLPIDSSTNTSEKIKRKRVNDVLNLVEMKKYSKKQINKLSGGEKQRVAIAKAIINEPKILLCDEPTGALDSKNSSNVFTLLKNISKTSLVIIATHDLDEVSKIADKIIRIEDGKIIFAENRTDNDLEDSLPPIIGRGKKLRKGALPLSFQIKHSFHKINVKKVRFLISNLMISLSLTGIGLSLIITNSVQTKLQSAFSNLLNGNQIVMEPRNSNNNIFDGVYSASEEKVFPIYERYSNYLNGVGSTYIVNFEDFFKDTNEVYFDINSKKYLFDSLSIRSINDFVWSEDMNKNLIMPFLDRELEDDEIIIGLNYLEMTNLCFALRILRNFNSLSEYVFNNFLTICFHVRNDDWQYEDEQVFRVVGVFEAKNTSLVHTNLMWNKVVFEDNMRFPANDGSEIYFPWEMYRILYFHTIDDPKKFLDIAFYDELVYDYVFERTSYDYHPLLCKIGEVCSEKRVLIYYVDKKSVRPNILKSILNIDVSIKDYYFSNDLGYASYASNFLSGFAKNFFVSISKEKIDAAIDADTMKKDDENIEVDLPKGVIQGNYMTGINGGLRYSSHPKAILKGRLAKNNDEIVISKGLADSLDSGYDVFESILYLSSDVSASYDSSGNKKDYRVATAKIVGIINEEKPYLYHDHNWTTSFFRDKLGVSSFYLAPRCVIFELDNNVDSQSLVNRLNRTYNGYLFSNPILELSDSINSTMEYANTILIVFSVIASIISILLLATMLIINVLESRQEIKTLKYTGIRKNDILSSFVVESMLQTMMAFTISAFEMILIDFLISYVLDDMLGASLTFTINVFPILVVFLIAFISSFLISELLVSIIMKNNKKRLHKSN